MSVRTIPTKGSAKGLSAIVAAEGRTYADDALLQFGTGDDVAVLLKSAALTTDAALAGVIVAGSAADHPGAATHSLIIGNTYADGDIMLAVQSGGDTTMSVLMDASAAQLAIQGMATKLVDGKLLVGDFAPFSQSVAPHVQIAGADAGTSSLGVSFDAANTLGPTIVMSKSRSATLGQTTPTIVGNNDKVGTILWTAGDGVNRSTVLGQIQVLVDDTAAAASSIAGEMIFSTSKGVGADDITEALRLTKAQEAIHAAGVYLNETVNTFNTLGLTLNQGANDDDILTFKSSDLTHLSTATAENDTFASFRKSDGARGGLLIQSFMDDSSSIPAMRLRPIHQNDGVPALIISGAYRSGTSYAGMGTDGTVTRFHGSANVMNVMGGGLVVIGDDSANGTMVRGLTINQGAGDDQIFALKSSDVATGLTTAPVGQDTETDTFFSIEKRSGTLGGATLKAYAEDDATGEVFVQQVYGGTASTNKTTGARGLWNVEVYEHDGGDASNPAALTDITANGNIFTLCARVGGAGVARFLVDEDGDVFAVNATVTAFDAYDDVALASALDYTSRKGVINSEWEDFTKYNEQVLIDAGILGAPISDGGMLNVTQLQRMHNGAIRQLGRQLAEMDSKLALAERKLAAIGE